ncbi:hypothetical protein [Candidatus Blastococcus massiliensis]|uniref:hypothetical protein n=1 Tax=Candidatus Blastococcus massiliensis TaxID=1470358 RepID=UPI0012DE1688|nr:hypothetical protein [Candidatus Blastococcus massiliensis]
MSTATDALRKQHEAQVAREEEAQEAFDKYYESAGAGFTLDDVALADVPKVARAATPVPRISFQQATLTPPGGVPIQLNHLRIAVDAIDAWWVLDDEAGAEANYVPRTAEPS